MGQSLVARGSKGSEVLLLMASVVELKTEGVLNEEPSAPPAMLRGSAKRATDTTNRNVQIAALILLKSISST
jgi:hypothetical protein